MIDYRVPSPFTDLGKAPLPSSIPEVVARLRGLFRPVTIRTRNQLGLTAVGIRCADEIARIVSPAFRTGSMLPPDARVKADSRTTAIFLTAIFRASARAARVRCGFTDLLETGAWTSRWVCELWDAGRWCFVDPFLSRSPVLDDLVDGVVPSEAVRTAPEAWIVCRAEEDSRRYGFGRRRGLGFVRGSLYRDVCALNRIELLSVDHFWGFADKAFLPPKEMELLDRLAKAARAVDEDSAALEKLFQASRSLGPLVRFELGLGQDPEHAWPRSDQALARALNDAELDDALADGKPAPLPLAPREPDAIVLSGGRENNLCGVAVRIPHRSLTVVTGVSGSGKSSLAFDTIYATSHRRFVEGMSTFTRRYLDRIKQPDVDSVTGLLPAVAIRQGMLWRNPRSSVGTITGLTPLLRLLFSRIGEQSCVRCGHLLQVLSAESLARRLARLGGAPRLVVERHDWSPAALEQARRSSWTIEPAPSRGEEEAARRVVVADGRVPTSSEVAAAFELSDGTVGVAVDGEEAWFSDRPICPACRLPALALTSQHFAASTPIGMCPTCSGVGSRTTVDLDLIVTEPERSILDGAIGWFGNLRTGKQTTWPVGPLEPIAAFYGADLETPWSGLPERFKRAILYGSDPDHITFARQSGGRPISRPSKGLVPEIERLFRTTESASTRAKYQAYIANSPCPECEGSGLRREALSVRVLGRTLPEALSLSIIDLDTWLEAVASANLRRSALVTPIVDEVRKRLGFMLQVSLEYLTLDRTAPTLSGGEGQRLRLARQLGIELTGLLVVLDEPSVGLHQRDVERLKTALLGLRSQGSTVLLVEHDTLLIRAADHVIELGPGAGRHGGRVVIEGSVAEVLADASSETGAYLSGRKRIGGDRALRPVLESMPRLWLRGARLHNLRNVSVSIPHGRLTCVSGVSGSGKSSLITRTLLPAIEQVLAGSQAHSVESRSVSGVHPLKRVAFVDQSPIGRTPRSCPATYAGVFEAIRKLFAGTEDARSRQLDARHFSFNTDAGRCPRCKGYGAVKYEMHFMADVWLECDACSGRRYKPEILDVYLQGLNIAQVLDLEVGEAAAQFRRHKHIARILQALVDVGLGYIHLGQSGTTLSAGEAQRLKLARELSRTSSEPTLYVLDEPTIGLHQADTSRLLEVVQRLVDQGHTAVVIEHNLEVLRTADWLIDLGPEGGDRGGELLYEGPVVGVLRCAASHTGSAMLRADLEGR